MTAPTLSTPLYWTGDPKGLQQYRWRLGWESKVRVLLANRKRESRGRDSQQLVLWVVHAQHETPKGLAVSTADDRADVYRWLGRIAAWTKFGHSGPNLERDGMQEILVCVIESLLDSWNGTGWKDIVIPEACSIAWQAGQPWRQLEHDETRRGCTGATWDETQEDIHDFLWAWTSARPATGTRERRSLDRKIYGGQAVRLRQRAQLLYILGLLDPEHVALENRRLLRTFSRSIKTFGTGHEMDGVMRSLEDREKLQKSGGKKLGTEDPVAGETGLAEETGNIEAQNHVGIRSHRRML